MLQNIRIVLVETSHSGNIGSASRAMKTMGLSNLYLVSPKSVDEQSITLAAGADDVVRNAHIVDTFEQAIEDCSLVIGTSARLRHLQSTLIEPRESAEKASAHQGQVAIVFGRERVGLTNEELLKCHYHLNIPANPEYSSLNLAMAVQLVSYEMRMAFLTKNKTESTLSTIEDIYPTAQEMEYFFCSYGTGVSVSWVLFKIKGLYKKLRRLYNRSSLEKNELNILRGMFKCG